MKKQTFVVHCHWLMLHTPVMAMQQEDKAWTRVLTMGQSAQVCAVQVDDEEVAVGLELMRCRYLLCRVPCKNPGFARSKSHPTWQPGS